MLNIYKISVRDLIEFILKKGNLDNRFTKASRALEGTIAHQKVQKQNSEIYDNYEKEVKIVERFKISNDLELEVEGRMDGVIHDKSNGITIEEIKSTVKALVLIDEEYNDLHWMQAIFYGYMYCIQNQMQYINLRLTYYNIETKEVKSFERIYTKALLKEKVDNVIYEYQKWLLLLQKNRQKRDESIKILKFPFDKYRKGQDKITRVVYSTIREGEKIFIQAPTGVGKTISTLFPALKGIGSGFGDKIIYLTAKSITGTVAEETLDLLNRNGVIIKYITLTAKEKICLNDKVSCNPEDCKFAKDYFSKVNEIVYEIITSEMKISRDAIEKYALKYEVCPFELSLELSEWCDCIVCDYNYVFDPSVSIKRFYENKKSILLIDEAHNLVERSREMYSASISKQEVMKVAKLIKGKMNKLYKSLTEINRNLIERRRELEESNKLEDYCNRDEKELNSLIKNFLFLSDEYLVKSINTEGYAEVLDLYFKLRKFSSIIDIYGEEHVTYEIRNKSDLFIKMYCVNPSKFLKDICDKSYSSIIFSATLEPLGYYIDLLGGDKSTYRIRLESPFEENKLVKYINPLNMKFSKRQDNIGVLSKLLKEYIDYVNGNCIVFFPSYKYMNNVYDVYKSNYDSDNIYIQMESMKEDEKEKFIELFRVEKNRVAFCVLGGMFSEGIDLVGEALSAVAIVGVGFPMISIERKIIMDYYNEKGFDYAYVYPGINKVLQGIGRVIRSEEDRGTILLIDSRYMEEKYRGLFSPKWNFKQWKNN